MMVSSYQILSEIESFNLFRSELTSENIEILSNLFISYIKESRFPSSKLLLRRR